MERNNSIKTTLREVQLSELGLMFGLVSEKYPELDANSKIERIKENFKVSCTKEDIDLYFGLVQDYELEGRRHNNGIYC